MTTKNAGIMENIKETIVSAVKATGDVAEAGLHAIGQTAQAGIRETADVGGELGSAAVRLVEGAIEAAKELGLSTEDAAAAAAHGALEAADKVGGKALGTVRNAVTRTISGVKVVLKEPFKSQDAK